MSKSGTDKNNSILPTSFYIKKPNFINIIVAAFTLRGFWQVMLLSIVYLIDIYQRG